MRKKLDSKTKASLGLASVVKILRELTALLVWASIFIEVFIADIGDFWTSIYPSTDIVFDYTLLLILAVLAISWGILGNKLFPKTFGYIAAYPAILILWRTPKLLIKNWAVVIAFSPAIYQFLRTFKLNFIIGVSAIVTAFVVCLAPSESALIPLGMVLIGAYLLRHFVLRFKMAYSSSTIFTILRNNVNNTWNQMNEVATQQWPKGDPNSDEYKQKFG